MFKILLLVLAFSYKNTKGNITKGTDSGIPSPIYPYINLLTNTERPNFIWHTVTNADSYNLIVGKIYHDGVDTVPVINTNLTDTFYIPNNSLSTGEYIWRVASYPDTGGISQYSINIYFRIDLDPPIITSVSPTDYTNENAPSIIAHYTDAFSGILTNSCILIIDNDTVNATATADSIYFKPSYTLTEGIHNVKVIAKDSAYNSSEYNWSFEVDYTPPQSPELENPQNDTFINSSTLSFEWHPVQKLKSPVIYNLKIINSTQSSIVVDTLVQDTTISLNLLEGSYYWQVCTSDEAGNTGGCSDTLRFTIDLTPPNSPIRLFPPNDAYINTSSPTFTWQPGDTESVTYKFSLTTTPYKSKDVKFTFDTILSDTVLSLPFSLEERTYYWTLISIDRAGNHSSYPAPYSFKIDTTPPQITYISIKGDTFYQDTFLLLKLAFTENVSIDTLTTNIVINSTPVSYQVISDTLIATLQLHNADSILLSIHLVDLAGNSVDSTLVFGIDNVPPETPILFYPNNGDTIDTSNITFIWSHSSLKSPVYYKLQCSIDSSFTYTIIDTVISDTTITVATLPPNTYYWRVVSRDAAGNTSSHSTIFKFVVSPSQVRENYPSPPMSIIYENSTVIFKLPDNSEKTPAALLLIFDRSGREVFSVNIQEKRFVYKWQDNYNRKLPIGIYYYKVFISKKTYFGKLIHYN